MSAVLLASGGLDSTVVAALRRPEIHVHIQYGQRNAVMELAAAAAVADHYGAHLLVRTLGLDGGPSSLTGGPGRLSGADTIVPGRNLLLIATAAEIAETYGADTVLIGANAADHDTYPDCRPDFLAAADMAVRLGSGGRVCLDAPLRTITKVGIGALARDAKAPVGLTWSCYDLGPVPCRTCGACLTREEAACS